MSDFSVVCIYLFEGLLRDKINLQKAAQVAPKHEELLPLQT